MKKNPFQIFRRLFVRTRKFNTTAARTASPMGYEEEDNGTRLSGAFVIVLFLHVVAVVGVFAFARIKESRNSATPPVTSTQTTAAKTAMAKPGTPKPAATALATGQAAARPPAPAATPARTLQSGPHTTHIVKEGETLTKIAIAYNVSVNDLMASNKLKNQNDIRPGQPLALPEAKPGADSKSAPRPGAVTESKPPTPTPPKGTAATTAKPATPSSPKKPAKTYVVRKGDTPLKIAREHGCSYEEIVKLNSIRDPKKIRPGQVLKLPGKNG